MKILHYMEDLNPLSGGVARAVIDICDMQREHGMTVTLLTIKAKDLPETWNTSGNKVTAHALGHSVNALMKWSENVESEVASLLASVDTVHIHGMWARSNVAVARLAKKVGTPYVWSPHGMLTQWSMGQKKWKKQLFRLLFQRKALQNCTGYHFACKQEASESKPYIYGKPSYVIPLPIAKEFFNNDISPNLAAEEFGLRGKEPLVLFLSRVVWNKHPEILIDAVAQLHAEGIKAHLAIAGTGPDDFVQQLHRQVSSLRLEAYVHFLGFVSGDLKISLYKLADVFALPTEHENYGMVFLEALACGTPVVTSDRIGLASELQESTGVTFIECNKNDIAKKIRDVFNNTNAGCQQSQKLHQWVKERVAFYKLMQLYDQFYRVHL